MPTIYPSSFKPPLPVQHFPGSVSEVETGEMVRFLVLSTCCSKFFACQQTSERNPKNKKQTHLTLKTRTSHSRSFWVLWQLRKPTKWHRTQTDVGFLSTSLDLILWFLKRKGSLLICKIWKIPKSQWLFSLWSLTWRILGRLGFGKEKLNCYHHSFHLS